MLTAWLRLLTLLLLTLTLAPPARTDDDEDPDFIPSVGRKAGIPFSEASGSFTIETRIDRESVQVEDPIDFVVRIMAQAPTRKPPQRIPLRELSRFTDSFHIEDLPNPAGVRAPIRALGSGASPGWALLGGLAPPVRWEFRYRLRPKSTAATEVPGVPLAFYDPRGLTLTQKFPVIYSEPIPIEVKPRAVAEMALQAPEEAFQLATGPEVLASVRPWSPPGLAVLALLFAGPPLVCLGWYLVWRRLNPDAARLALARRSRAAQLALEGLRKAPTAPQQRAQAVGRTVTRYLRSRLDLGVEEPTPAETVAHLARLGLSEETLTAVSRLYRTCDAARFAPAPPTETADLPGRAADLILAVEAETAEGGKK
jgi:hypothetical protein